MSKVQVLRALAEERLGAADGEVLVLFERTLAEYEEELCRTKEEKDKRQQLLCAIWSQKFLLNATGCPTDVHQLLGVKEQVWSPSVDQENPEPPHRPEELWTNEETEQLHLQRLRALAKRQINSGGDEILVLFERTISEYKQELCRTKEENERNRKLLDAVLNPTVLLHRAGCPADVHQLSGVKAPQDWSPTVDRDDPEPPHIKEEHKDPHAPHIKEEQEELWINQEAPFILVPVKTEYEEDGAQSSQLHQGQFQPEDSEDTEDSDEWTDGSEPESDLNQKTKPAVESRPSQSKRRTFDNQSSAALEQRLDGLFSPRTNKTQDPNTSADMTGGDDFTERDGRRKNKKHQCSECGKAFTWKSNFEAHMRIHTGEKPFACSECDKKFTEKATLHKHMWIHTGEKPYCCSVCQKHFRYKDVLKTHMLIHTGEKPFECSECGNRYRDKSTLRYHRKTHARQRLFGSFPQTTNTAQDPNTSRDTTDANDFTRCEWKTYPCSECRKTFDSKSYLKTHMKSHSGEKPFACAVCDRKFTLKATLRKHMIIHTGEKRFRCPVCQKCFRYKEILEAHMAAHAGPSLSGSEFGETSQTTNMTHDPNAARDVTDNNVSTGPSSGCADRIQSEGQLLYEFCTSSLTNLPMWPSAEY